jgi:hypothetical protein
MTDGHRFVTIIGSETVNRPSKGTMTKMIESVSPDDRARLDVDDQAHRNGDQAGGNQ